MLACHIIKTFWGASDTLRLSAEDVLVRFDELGFICNVT